VRVLCGAWHSHQNSSFKLATPDLAIVLARLRAVARKGNPAAEVEQIEAAI